MRDFLIGLALCGCALPGSECGMFEQENVIEVDPGPGNCARILMRGDAIMAKAPADECSAASTGSKCLILMPGETGRGFTPATIENVADVSSGTRHVTPLMADGTCPLTCD